jgi:hypothetical protein
MAMAEDVVGGKITATSTKCVLELGVLPAPETPDFESQIIPCFTSTYPA